MEKRIPAGAKGVLDMRAIAVSFALFPPSATLFGRGATPRVVGAVTGAAGAVVPSAAVTFTNQAAGVPFDATAAENGTDVFEAARVGEYRIEIEAKGFREFVSSGNRVTIGGHTTAGAVLEVGTTPEAVEVSGVPKWFGRIETP